MKYHVEVTKLGDEMSSLYGVGDDPDFFIIFNDNAPPELAELAVLHTEAPVDGTVEVGDTFRLGNKEAKITAVGEEAMHTLSTLGHCTIVFGGGSEPRLPGCIHVDGTFAIDEIKPGDVIEIF